MNKLNRRGLTLIELLGAIVISGVGVALLASVMTLIVRATEDTIINNRANSTGMIIMTRFETQMDSFVATDITTCSGVATTACFVLEKHYERTLDPADNVIKDMPLSPIQTRRIEAKTTSGVLNLLVDNTPLYALNTTNSMFKYNAIHITYDPIYANINPAGSGTYVLITLEIVIEDTRGKLYSFFTAYSFRARDPA